MAFIYGTYLYFKDSEMFCNITIRLYDIRLID